MIDPFFLCQLESNVAYIGNNGTDIGTPTYDPGKWNNGLVVSPAKFNDTLRFATNPISAEKFSMTFIYHAHTTYASMSSGFFGIMWYADSADLGIGWGVNYDGKISFNIEGNIGVSSSEGTFENGVNFSAGDDVAIALTFDNSAGSGNRQRAWMNGVELTKYLETGPGYPLTNLHLRFSTFFGGAYSVDAVIDNLKLYDGIIGDTEILWDASNELINPGVTPVPQNFTASDGLENQVTTSWDAIAGASPEYQVQRADTSGGSFSDISGWISATTYNDSTGVADQHYFYKVKARIGSTESLFSDEDEGYFIASVVYVHRIPVKKTPRIEVLNLGIDIYKMGYVSSMIPIVQERTFSRDKAYTSSFEIKVKNHNNFFSVSNPKSVFSGMSKNEPIRIWDCNGEKVFDGVIDFITRDYSDGKSASLNVSDILYKNGTKNVVYTSANWETPAQAFMNICAYIGLTAYDSNRAWASHSAYLSASCYIKVRFDSSEPVQFQTAIEKLADIGCADIYVSNGILFFRHWIRYQGTPVKTVTVKDMIGLPVLEDLSEEMKNNYSVLYAGSVGLATTDALNNSIGALSRLRHGTFDADPLDCGEDAQIQIKDIASAVYLGESIIKRSHVNLSTTPRPVMKISFSLHLAEWSWITLETYIGITFEEEGWTDKVFEVTGIKKIEDENTLELTAYEVDN